MGEQFLIRLTPGASSIHVSAIVSLLKSHKASMLMASARGPWLIATFDRSLVDMIRKLPVVQLVGGITFKGRETKVVRRLISDNQFMEPR